MFPDCCGGSRTKLSTQWRATELQLSRLRLRWRLLAPVIEPRQWQSECVVSCQCCPGCSLHRMSVASQPHLCCDIEKTACVCHVSWFMKTTYFLERDSQFLCWLYYIHLLKLKHRIPQDLKVTSLFSWYSAEAVEIC